MTCTVSDIENILKDHQDLYGANQRELSSLQLEIIYNKIRQCYLITLFLRVMSFIQEPKGMNLNDGHTLQFKNVIPDLVNLQIHTHKMRLHF